MHLLVIFQAGEPGFRTGLLTVAQGVDVQVPQSKPAIEQASFEGDVGHHTVGHLLAWAGR